MEQEIFNREKLKDMGQKLTPRLSAGEFSNRVIRRVYELRQQRKKQLSWFFRPLITPVQLAAALVVVILSGTLGLWFTLSHSEKNTGDQNLAKEKIVTRPVVFSYKSKKPVQVEVVGDFNGWQRGVHFLRPDGEGNYSLELMLPRGRYQYQFVVDGELWQKDPQCKETVDDGFGNQNSLLVL